MKRKFVTEYGLNYISGHAFMTTAHDLLQKVKIDHDEKKLIDDCHIYIIASRPSPYFKDSTLNHKNGMLSGTVCYKINGKEFEIPFNGFPWEIKAAPYKIECNYPFREIVSYDSNGKEETYMPASLLATMCLQQLDRGIEDLNCYEILYIGQAFGTGDRSALDRLKSHSTLQKILAINNHECPDKEIMIFMFQFENDQLISSMDNRDKDADNSEKNEERLINVIKNPPNKKQKIGMVEAALIRYFQPRYNEIFKNNFPSKKHKILESCYNLDVTSLMIEINTANLGSYLFSPTVEAKKHHIAHVDLVSSQNRRCFFNIGGMNENPNVIRG